MSAQPDVRYDDAIAGVAGFGLAGSLTSLPTAPLGAEAWSRFVGNVRAHNIVGLLGAAVAAAAIPVTNDQARDVRDLVLATGTQSRLSDEAVVEACGVLSSAGIDSLVLGESAVARLDHRAPTVRCAGVAELLLPDDRLAEARTILAARGYRARLAAARDGRTSGEPTRYTTPNGSQIAVLTRPAWLKRDPGVLWKRFETFEINGRQMFTLGREERLLDTCFRAGAADHDLGGKRDLAEAALHAGLNADRAVHLAETWDVDHALATTVHAAWLDLQLADVVALSTWARSSHHHDRRRGASGRSSHSGASRQRGLLARAFDFLPGVMR